MHVCFKLKEQSSTLMKRPENGQQKQVYENQMRYVGELESEGGRKAPKSDIELSGARTVADDAVRRTDHTSSPRKEPVLSLEDSFLKELDDARPYVSM